VTGGDRRRGLQEVKDLVKERSDLAEVIGRYSKLVREAGGYKCCCPLPGHKEKTPSSHINTREKYFYCYGCRRGGDIFSFLELVEGLSFMEALKELAGQNGIELPAFEPRSPRVPGVAGNVNAPSPATGEAKNRKMMGLELLDRGTKFFQRLLWESPAGAPALAYLRTRGISDEEIQELKLGWAPEGRATLLSKIPSDQMAVAEAVGLVRNFEGRRYDFFQERLMIPIADHRGRVLAFSGRTLRPVDERNPKYKNSPETEWFKKKTVVYGLDRAARTIRDHGFVAVVEGYFDQWALQKSDVPSVAVMGTALTPEHMDQLLRYTRQIVLVLDTDAAGVSATLKSLPGLLRLDCDVKVFSDLDGKDPADWLMGFQGDPASVRQRLLSAPNALEWWVERIFLDAKRNGFDRVQTLRELAQPWSLAASRSGQRRVLAEKIALVLFGAGMDFERVVADVSRELDRSAPRVEVASTTAEAPVSGIASSKFARTQSRVRSATRGDRLAEELFVHWVQNWDLLRDETLFRLPELQELLAGSPAAPFVAALEARATEHGMPDGAWLRAFLESLPSTHELRAWILAGLVGIEGEESTFDKAMNSFNEFALLLKRDRLQGELVRLQRSLKSAEANAEESARILNEIQNVRLRLENAREPARV